MKIENHSFTVVQNKEKRKGQGLEENGWLCACQDRQEQLETQAKESV